MSDEPTELVPANLSSLMTELATIDVTDSASLQERSKVLCEIAKAGGFPSLEPLLPLMLNLDGRPYTLKDHYAFAPFFRCLMPRELVYKCSRQVSKSTSLASSGVVLSNALPFFRTLYVTPLFEQIRRFSNNYVRPFIDQSPIKSQWTDTNTENNVLQRSFKNKSLMLFSFALLDADRCRGISSDTCNFDESVKLGTMVATPRGSTPIEALNPGDSVLSFDQEGQIYEDRVVTRSDHGVRGCFKIEYANGASVEATTDTFVQTTRGWRRISRLIEDFYAAATADDSRNTARRRLSDTRSLSKPARLLSAQIQHGEVPDIIRVRTNSTQEREERRLRRMAQYLGNIDLSAIAPYSGYVLPGWREDGDCSVASPTQLGGDSLVVPGRREPIDKRAGSDVSHRGAGSTQCAPIGGLAAGERYCGKSVHVSEEGAAGRRYVQTARAVSNCKTHRGEYAHTCRQDSAVRCAEYAVQDCVETTNRNTDLSLVQESVQTDKNVLCAAARSAAELRRREMSRVGAAGDVHKTDAQTRYAQAEKHAKSRAVLCKSDGKSCNGSRVRDQMACTQSGQGETSQSQTSCKGSRNQAATTVDVPAVRVDRTARGQRKPLQVLPDVSKDCDRRNQTTERIEASEIVKISYVGQHRVFDIETERNHTFFGGGVTLHNCQDLDPNHFGVIKESMSYSRWGLSRYTGTPKSLSNPLEGLWRKSSEAEWFVKCESCQHWNIPSLEYDLNKMIGEYNIHISEKYPATVCAKCQKPVNPRYGRWVHKTPAKRWSFPGYHVPQIIMPLHFSDPEKWSVLLQKREGAGNMTQAQFYNEVLGESVDAGQKLVTETELKAACILPWPNKKEPVREAMANLKHYVHRILAIDWGGGGEEGVSFTVPVVMGLRPGGEIDVLWAKRLLLGADHLAEAMEVMRISSLFKTDFVAHDYTGAGAVRETVMVQAGFNLERVMAMRLCRAAHQDIVLYHPPTPISHRAYYSLDKTRSLLYTCQAIKMKLLRFFRYDWEGSDNTGLIADFLALVENKVESRTGSDIYTITRNTLLSDDFAQAVNIGAAGLWHISGAWPNFAKVAGLQRAQKKAIEAEKNARWEQSDTSSKFFGTP